MSTLQNRTDTLLRKQFLMIISGSGNCSIINNDFGKALIYFLHCGYSLNKISDLINLTKEDLKLKIIKIENVGLIRKVDNCKYLPNLYVALKNDVQTVTHSAKEIGTQLGKKVESDWDNIEAIKKQLIILQYFGWERIGFHILGAKLLDVGMLNTFYRDSTIMPAPPNRKPGQYYCWMVEGESKEIIGKYGQRRDKNRYFECYTFGLYNKCREKFYNEFSKLLEELANESYEKIISAYERIILKNKPHSSELEELILKFPFRIPLYGKRDIELLDKFIYDYTIELLNFFKAYSGKIKITFNKTEASRYNSLPQFFCWYYHLIYVEAIDYLASRGLITIPESKFEYWLET